jgi:Uma2 family endonuclease
MASGPSSFRVDPKDPRAPSERVWSELTAAERQRVVDELPSEYPSAHPEGDHHRIPKEKARDALQGYFQRIGRRVYLSSELPVYYPGEEKLAPDLLAVLDVETHPRQKWVTSVEGKGLDLALEITLAGDRRKDLEDNVTRYARLGIPECFVYDVPNQRLRGYRLEERSNEYSPIVPQAGTWASRVLGLELGIDDGSLRFYSGNASIPDSAELIVRLTRLVDDSVAREQAALQRAEAEQQRAEAEQQRAEAEQQRAEAEQQRADRLEARLRELGVDPDDV